MEYFKISTSAELIRLPVDDIVYIKADGNYSDVCLFNGKVHTMTFQLHFFEEALAHLHTNPFVRVGKSLLVNKNYIRIISLARQTITLTGSGLRCDFEAKASKEALRQLKTQMEEEQS